MPLEDDIAELQQAVLDLEGRTNELNAFAKCVNAAIGCDPECAPGSGDDDPCYPECDKGDIVLGENGTVWTVKEDRIRAVVNQQNSGVFYVTPTAASAENLEGRGTETDPYVCSDQDSLGALLEDATKIPNGAQVVIKYGEYIVGRSDLLSDGGPNILDRSISIDGVNKKHTIIKLADGRTNGGSYSVLNFNYSLSYDDKPVVCSVRNLTLDANFGGQGAPSNMACGAVRFLGKEIRLADLDVINCGNSQSTEAFYVSSISQVSTNPLKAFYERIHFYNDLTVSGKPSSAIFTGGQIIDGEGYNIGGCIRDCYVHRAVGVGIGVSNCIGGLDVAGNHVFVDGVGFCYLHDVRKSIGIHIHDNTFYGCGDYNYPVMVIGNFDTATDAAEDMRDYNIHDNIFYTPIGARGVGQNQTCIRISHGVRRAFIKNNLFSGAPGGIAPGTPYAQASAIAVAQSSGNPATGLDISCIIQGNTYDTLWYPNPGDPNDILNIYTKSASLTAATIQSTDNRAVAF